MCTRDTLSHDMWRSGLRCRHGMSGWEDSEIWNEYTGSTFVFTVYLYSMIGTIREGYKGSGKWRSLGLLLMLVSYVEEPKATRKGVSYYITTLWSYSVSMLHVMDGGRASPLYRHPVREAVEGYTVNRVYRISRIGLYRVYRVYRVYRIRLQ